MPALRSGRLVVLLLLGALACDGAPTAPASAASPELIARLDSIASAVAPEGGMLSLVLRDAVAILRYGAPVNRVTMVDGGQAETFAAVALRQDLAYDGGTTTRSSWTLIAWREGDASTAIEIVSVQPENSFARTLGASPAPEDSAVYIGNETNALLALLADTSPRTWRAETASVRFAPGGSLGTCQPPVANVYLAPGTTCRTASISVRTAGTFAQYLGADAGFGPRRAVQLETSVLRGIVLTNR